MNKLIIVSLLYFSLINAVLGCELGGGCWIDLTETECGGTVIVDVDNNADVTKPLREYLVRNINEINTAASSEYANINLNAGKTHIIITLTDKFKEYAENKDDSEFAISVNLIGCTTKVLIFLFNVKETYNNPPVFLDAPYDIPVGSPILPSAEIKGISARDIDIGTKKLMFTICDDPSSDYYFTDSVQNSNNKKIYDTILKTRRVVELEDDVTLDICVTDDHNNPVTVRTTLTLKIDKTVSKTPDPVFQEPVYRGIYNMKTGLVEAISTSLNNALYTIKKAQLTDFSDKFELTIEKNQIIISEKSDIPEEDLIDKKYILMILEAEYEGADKVGKTGILLDIEGNTVTTLITTTTVNTKLSTTFTNCPPCSTFPTTTATECHVTTSTATEYQPCSTATALTSTDITSTTTCPICAECPICSGITTTTSPDGTTTEDSGTISSKSTTVQPVIVKYDYPDRNFAITSSRIGQIGTVVATSTISEDIEYRIEKTSNDEVILPNLAYNLNTGELTTTAFIETGIYHFTLQATGKISKSEGKINIKLTSVVASDCNDEPLRTV